MRSTDPSLPTRRGDLVTNLSLTINNLRLSMLMLSSRGRKNATNYQIRSIGCKDIKIFFWFFKIRLGHIWTTPSEYLWVAITLQNLVMIDGVVLIMWTFQCSWRCDVLRFSRCAWCRCWRGRQNTCTRCICRASTWWIWPLQSATSSTVISARFQCLTPKLPWKRR